MGRVSAEFSRKTHDLEPLTEKRRDAEKFCTRVNRNMLILDIRKFKSHVSRGRDTKVSEAKRLRNFKIRVNREPWDSGIFATRKSQRERN